MFLAYFALGILFGSIAAVCFDLPGLVRHVMWSSLSAVTVLRRSVSKLFAWWQHVRRCILPTSPAVSPALPLVQPMRIMKISDVPTNPASLPGKTAVICCYFNPAGWRSLRKNYHSFLGHLSDHRVDVFKAEVAFSGQDFPSSDAFIALRATESNILWQKERLFNLVVERLPAEYDKIVCVDSDLIFFNADWPAHVAELLQTYSAAQLFERLYELDPHGAVYSTRKTAGFGGGNFVHDRLTTKAARPVPSGAWALRRSVFPLYDRAADGAGDALTLRAWTGNLSPGEDLILSQAELRYFCRWAPAAFDRVCGSITHLHGDCAHLFHGSKAARQYLACRLALVDFNFDPEQHIKVDGQGLLAWTAECPPDLRLWMQRYFASRQDDTEAQPNCKPLIP